MLTFKLVRTVVLYSVFAHMLAHVAKLPASFPIYLVKYKAMLSIIYENKLSTGHSKLLVCLHRSKQYYSKLCQCQQSKRIWSKTF